MTSAITRFKSAAITKTLKLHLAFMGYWWTRRRMTGLFERHISLWKPEEAKDKLLEKLKWHDTWLPYDGRSRLLSTRSAGSSCSVLVKSPWCAVSALLLSVSPSGRTPSPVVCRNSHIHAYTYVLNLSVLFVNRSVCPHGPTRYARWQQLRERRSGQGQASQTRRGTEVAPVAVLPSHTSRHYFWEKMFFRMTYTQSKNTVYTVNTVSAKVLTSANIKLY